MRLLVIGACASLLAGAALAQPYDQSPTYPNDRSYDDQGQPDNNDDADQNDRYQSDRDQNDNDQYRDERRGQYRDQNDEYDRNDYSNDSGYRNDRDYGDNGRAYQRGHWMGVPAGAHYSGRVGQSWRDNEGRYCTYRELTWTDRNGAPAYKWVPRCHE